MTQAELDFSAPQAPAAVPVAPVRSPPSSGSATSRAAARRVASKSFRDESRLLAWLVARGAEGATDEEIRNHFGWTGDYERPRRWRLVKDELAIDSGRVRLNASESPMAVWVSVQKSALPA